MLSSYTWNNVNGGDFNTAANWNGPNNTHAVPGSGDDAVIPQGDGTITVSANTTVNSINTTGTTLDVTSGTLTLLNVGNQPSSSLQNLMVASGASLTTSGGPTTVVGTGTISGNLNVGAGAILNLSPTNTPFTLDAGATLTGAGTFNAASELYINAPITAPTNLLLESSNANEIDGPGTLTVPSGATLTWQAGNMIGSGGATNIAAGGTLLIQGNLDVGLTDRAINNSGTIIDSSSGGFSISGQAVLTSSGTFASTSDTVIGGNGIIDNNGSFTKTSPSGSGTTEIDPVFNNTGTVTATSGILDLNGAGIDTGIFNDPSTAGTIEVSGPTGYDLNAGATFTGAGSLLLESGFGVSINSSLTFPNLTVDFGVVNGAGSIYINGTLSTNAASFQNTGSLNINSVGSLVINGASQTTTFINQTVNDAGTTTLSGTDSFALAGTAIFNNSGKFTIQNDTVANIGGSFNLNGATFNNSGTLFKTSPSGPSGLTDITGGIFYNTNEVSVTSGQLQFDVQGTNSGQLDAESGTTLLLTNLINLNAGSTLTGPGLIANGNGLTANGTIDVNANVSANRLKFVGGTMNVSPGATFSIVLLNFVGGTIQGSGTVSIASGGSVGFTSPGGDTINSTTIAIAGTGNWSNTGSITMGSGAVIQVDAGSSFNIFNDQPIIGGSGGTLNVYGSLIKTSLTGVGTTTISVPTNILPGGVINLVSGNLFTGSLINVGAVTLGSQTVLNVTGTYTQPFAGTLNVAIGGSPASALFGQLNVSSTGSLNGTLNVTRANNYVPIVGAVYPIMTFSSRTGNFVGVNVPNNGIANLFSTSPQAAGDNLVATTSLPTAPTSLIIYPPDDTSGPGLTSIHQPRLTGRAQPGLQIRIYNALQQVVGTTMTGPAGYFIASLNTSLAPGTYTFTAVAVDTFGDVSPASNTLTLTILPPPPAPTGLAIYPADDTQGPGKTSNLQPRLIGNAMTGQGTVAAGLLVQIYEKIGSQSIYVGGALTDANGNFIIAPVSRFSIGIHNLVAVGIDAGGNFGTPSSVFALNIT